MYAPCRSAKKGYNNGATESDLASTSSSCIPEQQENNSNMLLEPSPAFVTLYRDQLYWREEETTKTRVEEWSVSELRAWIDKRVVRCPTVGHEKYVDLVQKLLRVMDQEEIDGALLLAGGKDHLSEKSSFAICSKRDRSRLPMALTAIFDAVQEAQDLHGVVPYWDRLWRGSADGDALCRTYDSNKEEGIGARLRLALSPHALEEIHCTALTSVQNTNVIVADAYVSKEVSSPDARPFKVVSLASSDNPSVVCCNLVYVRSDILSLYARNEAPKMTSLDVAAGNGSGITNISQHREKQQLCRRKERRRKKKNKCGRKYELFASVDFAQHGSAPPGHWHLNRTCCGDILPHLSICGIDDEECGGKVNGGGGRNNIDEVWHGREDCCPLWWHFIPRGMKYKAVPNRIGSLVSLE